MPTGKADLIVTVESPTAIQCEPWGVPATAILGIAAGSGTPPNDDTVQQWIQEHRTEKFE